ncbi:predicted protein [Lichtheimia corymbifera JMRC:FSU:9682]|uniref:Uncharacterized protein n=1 Tax=Lichtheimia corymbifera JMRC:FSU:9682 TaxID=1263082 RepID=A0A068SDX5_9FUNG|nr:predicted protein [Lichtheimia corymbifera JMRC:FSU:9682]
MMEDDDDIKQFLDLYHLSFTLNNINQRTKAKHHTWHTCLDAIELTPPANTMPTPGECSMAGYVKLTDLGLMKNPQLLQSALVCVDHSM